MAKIDSSPKVIDRLRGHFGSFPKVAAALGVSTPYTTHWRREGFIPESWALEIEALGVRDAWGEITVYDVLYEAAAVRRERVLEQLREERGGEA